MKDKDLKGTLEAKLGDKSNFSLTFGGENPNKLKSGNKRANSVKPIQETMNKSQPIKTNSRIGESRIGNNTPMNPRLTEKQRQRTQSPQNTRKNWRIRSSNKGEKSLLSGIDKANISAITLKDASILVRAFL